MISFPPNSRYAGLPTLLYTAPDGRVISYVARRIVPQPERFASLALHRLDQPTRLDLLADRYYGDPEQYWRICDANRVFWPPEATRPPVREVVIPLPQEVSRNGDA